MGSKNPSGEAPKKYKSLTQFGTWNTRAIRTALQEQDFSYIQNLQVIGPGNIRTVHPPFLNSAISNASSVLAYGVRGWYASIGGGDWFLVQTQSNDLWAANLSAVTPTFTQIATGTVISDVTSWDSTVALLVGPAGYYSWDGIAGSLTNISSNAVWSLVLINVVPLLNLTLTAVTGAYTVAETVTGGTSGATGVVTAYNGTTHVLSIKTVTGTFKVAEVVTGGTSGAHGTLSNIASATFTVGETVTDTPTGATGVVVSYNTVTQELVLQNSTGTFNNNDAVTGGTSGLTAVIATASRAGVPQSGNWIAVYANRVWIAQGRAVTGSAAGDYTGPAWDVGNGSFTFGILDSTLVGNITRLLSANGYLYIFGQSSIDIVSNVYVPSGASPPAPLFQRTNIDAINGTPYSYSIVTFGRGILFYNVYGVHALSGVQVERISRDIDQTMQQIDPAPPGLVSGAVGVSNNILTATFLLSWFDPEVSTSISRQTCFSFFDGKWFDHDPFNIISASNGTLAFVASAEKSGHPTAVVNYNQTAAGTSTGTVYELWNGAGTLVRSLKTAFWNLGSSIFTKQSLVFGIEGEVIDLNYNLQAVLDAEPGADSSPAVTFLPNELQWFNQDLTLMTWLNGSGAILTWTIPGYSYAYSDVAQYGKYLGFTVSGVTGDAVISGFNLEYEVRATWKL